MLVLTAVVIGSIGLGLGLGLFFTKFAERMPEAARTAQPTGVTDPECVLT